MTAKCALIMALLDGRVVNVKTCFKEIGLTNAAREIGRSVEKPFGVIVSRTKRKGKNRYGGEVTWVDYVLNKTEYNQPGIQKMIEYCETNKPKNKKTEIQTNKLF